MQKIAIRLAAAALLSAGLGTPVPAQTLSYADAVTQLADACGRDIKTLCKGLNLGNGRIYGCLQERSAEVSQGCKTSLAGVLQSIAQREHAQASYKQLCRRDAIKSCGGNQGRRFRFSLPGKKGTSRQRGMQPGNYGCGLEMM